MKKLFNTEYAFIQGSYWMIYGFVSSFASVFLLAKEYSNTEIGIILAVANIIAVLLQPFLADLADRSRRISLEGIIQLMTIMMMIMTACVFLQKSKSLTLTIVFSLLIAWHTVLQPLIYTLSFKLQENDVHINFGVARGLGSLAYSGFMAILGIVVNQYGINVLPISAEIIMLILLCCLYLIKLQQNIVNKKSSGTDPQNSTGTSPLYAEYDEEINLIRFIQRNKIFCIASIGVIGLFFSNSVMNNYMMQIVNDVGGNSADMGRIMSLMAFLEIPTMFFFDFLRKKFTCQFMLKLGAIGFTAKIIVCHFAQSVNMLLAAQFFQLVAFGLFLPAMVHFIDEIMQRGEAAKGQTVFTMMITLTTVFSSLAGGIILDISSAKILTFVSSAATAAGALVILLTVDRIQKK